MANNLNLDEHFNKRVLADLPRPADGIVIFDASTPLIDVAAKLSSMKIQSAPIRDLSQGPKAWERFPGIIDMVEAMRYILETAQANTTKPVSSLQDIVDEIDGFGKATAGSILKPRDNNLVPLTPTSSLLDAVLVMGYFGVRRIPVVSWSYDASSTNSEPDGVDNYITQSTVLSEVMAMSSTGAFSLDVPLAQFDVGSSEVVAVSGDSLFIDALKLMADKSISGVPVIDNSKLTGHISASDVHYIIEYPVMFELVCRSGLPVKDFFAILEESDEKRKTPVTIPQTATFTQAIQAMLSERIHRVYMVDDAGSVAKVISAGDIIKSLVSLPPNFLQQFVMEK